MSLAWRAYRVLAPALAALAPAARFITAPGDRALWDERLGRTGAQGPFTAWVHAASLGEATAVAPLLAALAALQPDARFHVTATTRTGRARLAALGTSISLAPLDAPGPVGDFLDRVAPSRAILVETELWPHTLQALVRRRIPVLVLSARLSSGSVSRYRRLGREFRALVGGLGGIVCQTAEDASRWLAIGARPERLAVGGNLKFDALPTPAPSRPTARADMGLDADRPLLVLGSLRPGEARIVSHAWRMLPDDLRRAWQVVAVPRHARATRALRAEAEHGARDAVAAWRWDDRPGVLIAYYAGADVCFVGGSLRSWGGHNPLEAAACGCAVVMGPHHEAQREGVRALEAGQALVVVRDVQALRAALASLLGNEHARSTLGAAARATAEGLRGAAQRSVSRLVAWNLWPVS